MHAAFELTRELWIDELGAPAQLYRHRATGAEVLSISIADENKVFGITFRTPPADSTGIAHILEHSVLCGSQNYPLKEPFVELLKSSLQTFLNAMTYPDKTCYPVASQNLRDFYNLVDVYLDAVLRPRLSPDVLAQEGWHLEPDPQGDGVIVKGVVYNEMKGVYSSPDSLHYRAVQRSLFPATTYGVDSGGDPTAITDLGFEQFAAFHAAYYHPANARIFFYGDDPVDERLRRLDAALQGFGPAPVTSQIAWQPPFTAPRRIEQSYPAPADGPTRGMLSLSWMIGRPAPAEQLLWDVLEHVLLGSSVAPLRRALLDSGLGENLTGAGCGELLQWYFTVGLKGVPDERLDEVEMLILTTLEQLVQQGIDPAQVEASLNTIEFRLRENNTGGYPRGLALMLQSLRTWLYGEDPLLPLQYEAPLAQLRARLAQEPRLLEQVIASQLLANPHRTTVVSRADAGYAARVQDAEHAWLADARATLDDAGMAQLAAAAERLRALQARQDPPEVLALLPSLRLSDMTPTSTHTPTTYETLAGVPLLWHPLATNGIVYLDLAFDLTGLPAELLPYVTVLGRALLETGAGALSRTRLTQWIGRATGGIWVQPITSASRDGAAPVARFVIRSKATVARVGELLAILHDVIHQAHLDDRERIGQIIREEKASREAGVLPGGHSVINGRLRARFSVADWVAEQLAGVSFLETVQRDAAGFDAHWPRIHAALETLRAQLLTRSRLIINLTADDGGRAASDAPLATLLGTLRDDAHAPRQAAWQVLAERAPEGLAIPAQVNYVGKAADLAAAGYRFHGSALVVTRFLRTAWLWERIRVQGGAYGAFSSFDSISGVFSFLSYRDPNLAATLATYDATGQFLRGLAIDDTTLERAIIATIGDLDAYQLPDARGFSALVRHLNGTSDAARQHIRDEVLGTTAADVRAFADQMDVVRDVGQIVVLGSEATLTAAALPGMQVRRLI